ncbi:MAG: acyloxyacyl hydrolase [Candidatus Omnitrophota bacterium]
MLLAIIFISSGEPFAEEEKPKSLAGIEFLAGFSSGELVRGQRSYMMAPISVAFDFNIKNWIKKIGFNPAQLFQFQIEPFAGFISSPKNNLETGAIFWLKMGFVPDTWKLQPYGKLGVGLDYMTLHTREQSTQFNFTEQSALGMHYYFNGTTAFTLEGRWRHLSNASIKQPNHGFNSYSLVTGISYKF